jgi:hypothetical protein
MRIINARMSPEIFKKMDAEKNKLDMNWEEYLEYIFLASRPEGSDQRIKEVS